MNNIDIYKFQLEDLLIICRFLNIDKSFVKDKNYIKKAIDELLKSTDTEKIAEFYFLIKKIEFKNQKKLESALFDVTNDNRLRLNMIKKYTQFNYSTDSIYELPNFYKIEGTIRSINNNIIKITSNSNRLLLLYTSDGLLCRYSLKKGDRIAGKAIKVDDKLQLICADN